MAEFKEKRADFVPDGPDKDDPKKKRVLLVLLPFWTPLIPPLGISGLKSYLKEHGFNAKTLDANTEIIFKEILDLYFNTLRKIVPEEKWGNFLKSGYEVLRNHMAAHLNYTDIEQYHTLITLLIYRNYYVRVLNSQVGELAAVLEQFYQRLDIYLTGVLEEEKPDVLGISTTSGTLPATIRAFEIVHEKFPHIRTVMGGCLFSWDLHQSPDFQFFLEQIPHVDKIIIGEGEQLFLKLLQGELPESQRIFSLADLGGKALEISKTAAPDLTDFDTKKYPYLVISGSIGCSFNCNFCNFPTLYGKFRKKNARRIVEEMTALYKKHHSQLFFMSDLLINPILTELTEAMKDSEYMFYWDGHLRADAPVGNPENTLAWRRAGMYRARLGLESGSQRVLDLMNKNLTVEQSKAALSSLAYAGIKTSVFIVVGFPGETGEEFRMTLDMIEEYKNEIWHVESTPFQYFYSGQAEGDAWAPKRTLLYPPEYRDMLVTQTWALNLEPSQEKIFDRLNRLEMHCQKLGIPGSLITLQDHHIADERWKRLHKNAVPGIMSFKTGEYIDEKSNIKTLILAEDTRKEDAAFRF